MPWSILWSETAARDLGRLDPPIARRVVRMLGIAARDPGRCLLTLTGSDERKLRSGDLRGLALLDPTTKTLRIGRVDHRYRIYE